MVELKEILIKIEDRRFFFHFGVDPIAVCRSFFVNLKSRRYAEGGSTITQQLARRMFLTNEKKMSRKIKEAFYAFGLESCFTKNEILDIYMTTVYMGESGNGPIVGFAQGAEFYFGKELTQLNLDEKIALVGMLKGPNTYGPFTIKGRERQVFIKTKILNSFTDTL